MDRRALDRFRKNRGALLGVALVAIIILFSFVAPLVSSHTPTVPDYDGGRGPFGTPGAPSHRHWLGTDTIFRDMFVRLAYGGRLSLEVAFVATTIAVALGTAVGVASGYFKGTRVRVDAIADAIAIPAGLTALAAHGTVVGHRMLGLAAWVFAGAAALRLFAIRRGVRWFELLDFAFGVAVVVLIARKGISAFSDHKISALVGAAGGASVLVRVRARSRLPFLRVDFDDVAMRSVDVLLAFPFLLLVMALSAAIERTSEATIFLVLGLTAWTGTARVIRSKTLQLRELEFVVASRALGQSTPQILVRHILPNVVGIAIVLGTNSVAGMIVAEAALSFLGLSLPPPAASWGRMLDEGRPYYSVAPWLLGAPAVAILIAVLGFNLLGEGLRDAFDPKDA